MAALDDQSLLRGGLARALSRPLIGIDGLPCAGKTTLAFRLADIYDFPILHVDEFIRAEEDWTSRQPNFPFPYIRYEEFLQAVIDLAKTGACTYYPFDWKIFQVSKTPKRLTTERPVIVEGISALVPLLRPYYGLKIFVDSDRRSIIDVAHDRALGVWADEWRRIFLPSVDMYMLTHPEKQADILFPGRGSRLNPAQTAQGLASLLGT
jgi:uridine kinase